MAEATRRNALRMAAAAGAGALGGMAPAAAAQERAGEGTDVSTGWGKEGDQSFKVGDVSGEAKKLNLPKMGFTDTQTAVARAVLRDNCNEKKDEIRARFRISKFGNCSHPTPVTADVEAATLMAQVIAEGGVLNTEFGHRTVRRRVGPVSYNTYLAYAGGDTV